MRFVTLAACLAAAVSIAACTPLTYGPMEATPASHGSTGRLLYGSAEPVRTPTLSYSRPRDVAVAAPEPVRSADLGSSRQTRQVNDAGAQSGDGADVVYSEKWYEREKETENRLTSTTKICRSC